MNEQSPKILKKVAEVETGNRYSAEIKELAFQLWAFKYAENASEVSRAISEGRFGDATAISSQIINYWARNGWVERKQTETREQYGPILEKIFTENVFLSLELITKFRKQIANDEPLDKVEAALYTQLIDRSGLSPMAKVDPGQILDRNKQIAKDLPDWTQLAKMTPEELLAEEAKFREKRK